MTIRNEWANATGVSGTLSTVSPLATVVAGSSTWGAVGPNARDDNLDNPFRVSISASAGNNEAVSFNLAVSSANGGIGIAAPIQLITQRGISKSGVMSASETWTAENLYLVTDHFRIDSGITLTIQPGTQIQFSRAKQIILNGGEIIARGTTTNRISFSGQNWRISGSLSPAVFDSNGNYVSGSIFEYCTMRGESSLTGSLTTNGGAYIARNILTGVTLGVGIVEKNLVEGVSGTAVGIASDAPFRYNSIVGNFEGATVRGTLSGMKFNNIFGSRNYDLRLTDSPDTAVTDNYWGNTDPARISKKSSISSMIHFMGSFHFSLFFRRRLPKHLPSYVRSALCRHRRSARDVSFSQLRFRSPWTLP